MSIFVADRRCLSGLADRLAQDHSSRILVANGLVVICLVCLLTIRDAFETHQLNLFHQLSLWAVVCLLLVTQLNFLEKLLQNQFSESPYTKVLASLGAIILTVFLMTIELHGMKFTPLLPKQPDPLFEFLIFVAPPVVAMAMIVLALKYLSYPNAKAETVSAFSPTSDETKKLGDGHQDLAELIRNNHVLHVYSDDHYLKIECEEGAHFVRGRMKDALAYLREIDGVQTHRSHWVSRSHLRRVFREGRDFKVMLRDGSIIPVARSRASQLGQIRSSR